MNAESPHPEALLDRARREPLSATQQRELEAHLEVCATCRFERELADEIEAEVAPQPHDAALLERVHVATLSALGNVDRSKGMRRGVRRAAIAGILLFAAAGAAAMHPLARWQAWRQPVEQPAPSQAQSAPVAAVVAASEPSPLVTDPAPPPVPEHRANVGTRTALPAVEPAPPRASAALFHDANEERRRGNDAEAARLYRQLQSDFPSSREAAPSCVALGRLMLNRSGDAAGALPLFDRYLADQPGGTLEEEALLGRALALMKLGRSGEERAAWELLVARHPESVHAARARDRLDKLR